VAERWPVRARGMVAMEGSRRRWTWGAMGESREGQEGATGALPWDGRRGDG
jgi:hypothetical protein